MIKLYGVIHGGQVTKFLGRTEELHLLPSKEFQHELKSLPKGSRVGVEWFSKSDQEAVEADLNSRVREALLFSFPYYDFESGNYWHYIINVCRQVGVEIVFLEDVEIWKRYNQANVEFAKLVTFGNRRLKNQKNFSKYNEVLHRAEASSRKIHEIDRDRNLLLKISSNGLDVVIVGQWHSDFWIANQERIRKEFNICFDCYFTDLKTGTYLEHDIFTRNAKPDPQIVFETESLERILRLIETGRVVEGREPDFVGIWELDTPSKGYFEVFIEHRDNGRVRGTIEDLVGTSTFEGILAPESFNFTKQYTISVLKAIKERIFYNAKRKGKGFFGDFSTEEFGPLGQFYMLKSAQEKPLDLAIQWLNLTRDSS